MENIERHENVKGTKMYLKYLNSFMCNYKIKKKTNTGIHNNNKYRFQEKTHSL